MNSDQKKFLVFISILSFLIIGLTLCAYCLNNLIHYDYFLNSEEYIFHTDKLGQFGDFIGGVLGTILTIVATIFIYYTFKSQKEALKVQKKELDSQKDELILNRSLIAQQQFESTFFNMINVHRQLKNDLVSQSYDLAYKNYKGVQLINLVNSILKDYFSEDSNNVFRDSNVNNNSSRSLGNDIDEKEIIHQRFKKVFDEYQYVISHYCRNVYHILKYIRENEQDEVLGTKHNKYKKYANIFQSQLNVDEQFLLFYNFIHFNDDDKGIFSTINLVNHYVFLENLGKSNLIDETLHNNRNFYNFEIK